MNRTAIFRSDNYQDIIADNNSVNLSHSMARLIEVTLFFNLFLSPLFFGSVHPSTFLALISVNLVVATIVLRSSYPKVVALLSENSLHGTLIQLTAGFIAFLMTFGTLQWVVSGFISPEHPILGNFSLRADIKQILSLNSQATCFLSIFILTSILLRSSKKKLHKLFSMVIFSGFLVSLIALSHWFNDNGKLFWIFEPNYIAPSLRARWPFVNPNTLGQYLLPILFLEIGVISASIKSFDIKNYLLNLLKRKRIISNISQSIAEKNTQLAILKGMYHMACVLFISLAISATLSRAAWLGVAIAGIFMVVFSKEKSKTKNSENTLGETIRSIRTQDGKIRITRRKKSGDRIEKKVEGILEAINRVAPFLRPLSIASFFIVFFFFLNTQGTQLIGQRIQYTLSASMDDVRLQFYKDSLKMFSDTPLFGIGWGNWAKRYPEYRSEPIAGLSPQHAHSEPIEILTEFGLVGTIPLLLLGGYLAFVIIRTVIASPTTPKKLYALGAVSGFIGLAIAACLDFPFRVPAVWVQNGVILSMICYLVSEFQIKDEK